MARSKRSEGSAGVEDKAPAVSASGSPATLSFEAALTELEGVVSKLESGDMPLEQALEAFEAGVRLSRRCASTLAAAERRIEILMAERAGDGSRTEPFGGRGREDDEEAFDIATDSGSPSGSEAEPEVEDDDPGTEVQGR